MGGIAGVFYRNKKPVEPTTISALSERLQHRGIDGVNNWIAHNIGVIHYHWATTSESIDTCQPVHYEHLIIAADARIDNRSELYSKLKIEDKREYEISDSELMIRAFLRWKHQCLDHFVGIFAFAIWDKKEERLFLASDQIGIKSLYYYIDNNLVAFASEIQGLRAIPEINLIPNHEEVIAYLLYTPLQSDGYDSIYQQVKILGQGHYLNCNTQNYTLHRYYDLNQASERISFTKDEDYIEAFRHLFEKSVRRRLRSHLPIGSELSGGLDSSAITAMAADLAPTDKKIHSYHLYTEFESSAEWQYASQIAHRENIQSHVLHEMAAQSDLEEYARWIDHPLIFDHCDVTVPIWREVAKRAPCVLLSGEDGDNVASSGSLYPLEFLRAENYSTYRKSIRDKSRNRYFQDSSSLSESERRRAHHRACLSQRSRELMAEEKYWSLIKLQKIALPYTISHVFKKYWPGKAADIVKWADILNPRYQSVTNTMLQYEAPPLANDKAGQIYYLTQGMSLQSFSQSDALSHRKKIDVRYPFMDRELVELCVATPVHIKWEHGYGRGLLRRGLDGVLPNDVIWRKSKSNYAQLVTHSMRKRVAQIVESSIFDHSDLDGYVVTTAIRKEFDRFNASASWSNRDVQSYFAVYRIMMLRYWLRFWN